MRISKIILIVFAVTAVVGLVGFFIFLKTFDINKYKPQIVARVNEELDHPFDIGSLQLDFSFKKGIHVALQDAVVHEKGAAEDIPPIIKVEKLAVGFDLRSYLMERKIIMSGIDITKPYIRLVQYADGSTNLQRLAKKEEGAEEPGDGTTPPGGEPDAEFDLNSFHIRVIELIDGEIAIEQQLSDELSRKITISDIDGRLEDFGFGHQFPMSAAFNLLAARQNVTIEGKISVREDLTTVEILDLSAKAALDDIDIGALNRLDPAIASLGLREKLAGDVNLTLQRLLLLNNTLNDFVFESRLIDGRLAPGALQYPIENIDMHLVGKYPAVTLKELFMYIGSGKIRADGQLKDMFSENRFSGELVLEDIRLEEIIPQQGTPYKLVGRLFGDIYFNGMHTAARPVDQALSAEATFSLNDARIKDLNVLREVLKKLSFIGGLEERLPARYQATLQQEDTVFHKFFVHSSVANGMVDVDKVEVDADGFFIRANGTMNLAQQLSLNAHFFIPADLAGSLLKEDMRFLLDRDGNWHIPFKPYRGPLAKLKIYPDIEKIGKAAVESKGRQELQKAIFKALDLEDTQPAQQPAAPSGQEPAQAPPEKSPSEKILIENVLDAIFK